MNKKIKLFKHIQHLKLSYFTQVILQKKKILKQNIINYGKIKQTKKKNTNAKNRELNCF